jgi:Flp pilus assembly protein TadG
VSTAALHSRPARAAPGVLSGVRARWRRLAAEGDRGAATAEFVLAVPLLMLMILFVPQAAVWYHATHVAQAAANRALDAAAANGGSAAQGETVGAQTLAALGSGVLHDPHVGVTRTATDVRVNITGTAETVVPGIHWTVHATAAGPVERFVPDLSAAGG